MNNFRILSLVSLFLASTAFADVQFGTYTGLSDEGAPCSIQTISKNYEGGMKHPLNERVLVQLGAEQYLLSHPALIDTKKSEVSFNHDTLQAVIAIKGGAKALVLDMDHSPGKDGPSAFHFMQNSWADGSGNSLNCHGLKFTR